MALEPACSLSSMQTFLFERRTWPKVHRARVLRSEERSRSLLLLRAGRCRLLGILLRRGLAKLWQKCDEWWSSETCTRKRDGPDMELAYT